MTGQLKRYSLEPRSVTATMDDAPWQKNLTGDTGLVGSRDVWWWTGPLPDSGAQAQTNGTVTVHSLPGLDVCTRDDVLRYFDNGWLLTELLFASLQTEDAFYRPPSHQLRHPLIFYYCHPAVVYVNKLRIAGLLTAPVDEDFERRFEVGVDEMAWDDLSTHAASWPSVRAVNDYRRRVYATVRALIETHPSIAQLPLTESSAAWALLMGMEHERIHLETSSVLIRELPIHLVHRPAQWPPYHPSHTTREALERPELGTHYPTNPLVTMPGTAVTLGKPRDYPSYGWDNEYGTRTIDVPSFQASQQLISNGEFYAFVIDQGYSDARYWSAEGWAWRAMHNVRAPHFWVSEGPAGLNSFRLRVLFDIIDMPWSWPAVVNYYEAKAYCAWRTAHESTSLPYRLLTEAEHHLLAYSAARTGVADSIHAAITPATASESSFNLQLRFGSESPVDDSPRTASGVHDARGNVWTWCEDHFAALPGFAPHYLYDDFSTPCFDGKHQLILGGSFISLGDEASRFARFHFRPHFHQHAGFRIVQSNHPPKTSCMDAAPPHVGGTPCCTSGPATLVYESDELLSQYYLLHFGTLEQLAPGPAIAADTVDFPARCARILTKAAARLGISTARALDIGCAVGGASFELARSVGDVVAADLSMAFIDAAKLLQRDGHAHYTARDEADLVQHFDAVIDPRIDRSRIRFMQADACALPADLGSFDLVLTGNLLCRLPSPSALLGRLSGSGGLVRPGGLLLNISPWSWQEVYTPKSLWLGGRLVDGEPRRSSDGLRHALEVDFELLETFDMALLIREHRRKFQYITPEATLWRRRMT